MIEIKPLSEITLIDLQRLIVGYTTNAVYRVTHEESDISTTFRVELETLEKPITKKYQHLDEEALTEYQTTLKENLSFGAYVDDALVGLCLAVGEQWNNSVRVQEFHIAPTHSGKGIGQILMKTFIEACQKQKFRVVICETQATNVPAIRFYRKVGFSLAGIDLSYYTNQDIESGEIAVFMTRQLM